jgi:hypothetical protein
MTSLHLILQDECCSLADFNITNITTLHFHLVWIKNKTIIWYIMLCSPLKVNPILEEHNACIYSVKQ